MIQKFTVKGMKGSSSLSSGLPKSEAGFRFSIVLNRTQLYVIIGAHDLIEKAAAKTNKTPSDIGIVREVTATFKTVMVEKQNETEWEFIFVRKQLIEILSMISSLINVASVLPIALNLTDEKQVDNFVNVFTDIYDTLRWGAIGQMPGVAQA